MAQIEQERIAHITELDSERIAEIIKSKAKAEKWALPIDYVLPDSETDEIDRGTAHITLDRVGLLTATHLVPQNMLPSRIENVLDGTMTVDDSGSTSKWTFETGGHKYVCPKPTAADEELPVIEYIYRDVRTVGGKTIYTQYRYVPVESTVGGEEEGQFVPIPSDLVLTDGEGTVINDDNGAYTRQVDLNIGAPVAATGTTVIEIRNRKLVHTTSGVARGSYPASQSTTPGFGSNPFSVPRITVNATGHVTAVVDDSTTKITVPNTPARPGTAGLVKIGTNNDIRPIAATNSIGTIPQGSDDYVLVAAADHTHRAATFTLLHTNDSPDTKEYAGTAEKTFTYDFDKFLKVPLPSAGPSATGDVLSIINDSGLKAGWVPMGSLIAPSYAFVQASAAAVTAAGSPVTLGTVDAKSPDLTVSSSGISGLVVGKVYAVSFAMPASPATVGTYLDEMTFSVMEGNAVKASCTRVVDESISGLSNHVSATIFFEAGATACSFAMASTRSGGPSWSISGGTIQIAEVK